jgi:hypothetical protein
MKNKHRDNKHDKFKTDPDEDLRIENEILHLKLKAELGGELISTGSCPPDLENTFLKNVLEFEHAFANSQQVRIYDFLGRPSFRKSTELDDHEIETALENVCELMKEKSIVLDFSGEYDARLKYTFITEELFEYQTDNIHIPGMITHYVYEEFHPNHILDIESRSTNFITGWINQKIDEDSWELARTFILPDKTLISRKEVVAKIKRVFDAYRSFDDAEYTIEDINFELDENNSGVGHCNGTLFYTAVLESGENIKIGGPFVLYLSMEQDWWDICYFVVPGFKWK